MAKHREEVKHLTAFDLNKKAYGSYYYYNNPEEARRLGQLALDEAVKVRDAREAGKAAKILAIANDALGDREAAGRFNEEALTWYLQALKRAGSERERAAAEEEAAKVTWGILSMQIKERRFEEAHQTLSLALPRWPQTARLKAKLALAEGDFRRALKLLDEAEALAPGEARNMHGISLMRAEACLKLKRTREAVEHAKRGLGLCEEARQSVRDAALMLGRALEAARRFKEALANYEISAEHSSRLAIRHADRRAAWLADSGEAFESCVRMRMQIGDDRGAWEASQAGQASIIREIAAGSALQWSEVPREVRAREEKIRQEIIRLHDDAEKEAQVRQLEAEREELLEKALDSLPYEYALSPAKISLNAVRRKLRRGEIVVSFSGADARIAYWIIGKERTESGVAAFEDADLVMQTLKGLMNDSRLHEFMDWFLDEEACRSFSGIVKLIESFEPSSIVIMPPPRFWEFPFHLLMTSSGERLGERYACRYSPCAGLKAARRSARGRALVVGDPKGDLPYAREEAAEVAELHGVRPLIGSRATRGAFLKAMRRAGVVHFAGHGRWSSDDADYSGLTLADGRLGPHDLLGQNLSHVQLISLMGCETGRVKVIGNEMSGFAMMALAAGCRNVLESVAPIADVVTPIFARAFHAAIAKDRRVEEAFRLALIAMKAEKIPIQMYAGIRVVGR